MKEKQTEAICHSLRANKSLRKRLDSTNPGIESARSTRNQASPNVIENLGHQETYKLFVGTWNIGGTEPPEHLNMDDWLDTKNSKADIYVLGFQEIVPLNAGNVLAAENSRICKQWNSLIKTALNKSTTVPERAQRAEVGEFQKVFPMKEHDDSKLSSSGNFQCIISKQMVGIFITVWARDKLSPYIKHTKISCVGCGIMGRLGNKGSVSVRFCLHGTSFCFVCCHLASGGKEGDEKRRNADVTEILSRTNFPCGSLQHLPTRILNHDQVIWLGDLNYRIYLPEATTRSLVEKRQWKILLQNDQLKTEFTEGRVFEGWQEETIDFAPTYKYSLNSDDYYGGNQNRKGKKLRTPAWCDRIIWFGKGLKQSQYSRGESRLSDHRPVRAVFIAEIKVYDLQSPENREASG